MRRRTYTVRTYGCQMNDHDSERISGLLEADGMVPAVSEEEADVIVALGGDGFMLQTLHNTQDLSTPVYGMNRGTVGFLMNAYDEKGLIKRLENSVEEKLNPLRMEAITTDGSVKTALAINEVSLLRAGPQAAKLSISIDGKTRMSELISDGVLLSLIHI